MANSISLYPTYENMPSQDLIIVEPYKFSYKDNGKNYLLTSIEKSGKVSIEDPRNIWTIDNNDLIIHGCVTVNHGDAFFGPKGIVCNDAVLGIALSWYSHDSNQRNVYAIGEIKNEHEAQKLSFQCPFIKASLRGALTFEIVLFVEKAGKPKSSEIFLANQPGLLLGIVDQYSIFFEGNGSIFPIYEESVPGEPLWRVKCEFADASNDSFEENVYIYLNKAHDCYKFLDLKSPSLNLELLAEVLGDAMATVVETVRSQDSDFYCLQSPQEGSVAQALLYFQRNLGWDFSKPEISTKSIRKYLEHQIKQTR